jgi:hypothetical protein
MGQTAENPGVLEDFSGGLNTLTAQNRLPHNQTPSANNVWNDDGALAKKPGQLRTNSGTILGRSYSGYSVHNSVFSGAEMMMVYGSCGIGANFLCYSSLGTDLNPCYTATTGTASCPGTTAVTGVGTNWLTGGAYGVGTAAPGAFLVNGNNVAVISTVNSDTSITLVGAFPASFSGSAVFITASWPSANRVSFADMNKKCWINGIGGAPVAWDGSNLHFINPLPIGTVVTSNASATVTGTGTKFTCISAAAITAGAATIVTPDGSVGVILSVQSDTSLTLTANYATNNAGGVTYTLPNFPQAAYSLAFSNYIFTANTTANPAQSQWSLIQHPEIFPPANFQNANPSDGFPIVGMFYDGQSNVVLKNNAAWKFSGTTFDPSNPTWTFTQIYTPSDFFINSPKSVQLFELAQGFIMLGKNGFYSYNGAGAITKLLQYDIVRSEFSQMNAFNVGNVPTVTAEPASIIVNGSYWLQVPNALSSFSNTDKELTYVIDKTGAFWQWQATANGVISDFCYFLGNLYGVNSYSGGSPGIIQLNTGSSDAQTTAINATYTTKLIEFKNQQRFGLGYLYYKIQTPVTPTGTVSTGVSSPTVTGVGTNFLTILCPGATITVGAVTGTVLTVNSNTSLTLTGNFGALNTSQAYTVTGGTSLNFSYSINGGSYITTQIDMTTGASGFGTTGKSTNILIGQIGRTIQFQVSNAIAAQSFEVYGIEFDRQELRQ